MDLWELPLPPKKAKEPSEIDTSAEYDATVGPQGAEFDWNTYYGDLAGAESSSDLYFNSFFGAKAGRYNTGSSNSFFGEFAGRNNLGSSNCFMGVTAGQNNKGSNNVFIGNSAGRATTSSHNCFIGYKSGVKASSARNNAFLGAYAGEANTTADFNTFIGSYSGGKNITGAFNTCIGYGAGGSFEAGSSNIFIGALSGAVETGSNKLYIGSLIYGEFDNKFLRINGNFTATATSVSSDKRFKKEIRPIEFPLEKISKIRGVRYRWKLNEFQNRGFTDGRQIGLIAQDVERVLPELVSEDKDGYKAVSYTKLTAVLVEAVKELKQENQMQKELLQQQIQKQQAEIEELRSMIKELKS